MMTNHPFREIRQALAAVKVEVSLLMAAPGTEWRREDYATYFMLAEMTKKIDNPSRQKLLMVLGTWLRFYRRLLDELPEDNLLRGTAQVEFQKISKPYEKLLA